MDLGMNFIPTVEFKQIDFLTDQDRVVLSTAPYFIIEMKSDAFHQHVKLNKHVLIDTNEELKENDLIIGVNESNSMEIFQFISEIQDEWKIKVKSLKDGKFYLKDLNFFSIYGVLVSER
jgi:hypothetical protein